MDEQNFVIWSYDDCKLVFIQKDYEDYKTHFRDSQLKNNVNPNVTGDSLPPCTRPKSKYTRGRPDEWFG